MPRYVRMGEVFDKSGFTGFVIIQIRFHTRSD